MSELRAKIKDQGLDAALHDQLFFDEVTTAGMNAEGPDVGRLCTTGRRQMDFIHHYVVMLCGTYELAAHRTTYKIVVRNTDGYMQDVLQLGPSLPRLTRDFRRKVLNATKSLALTGITCRDKIEDAEVIKPAQDNGRRSGGGLKRSGQGTQPVR